MEARYALESLLGGEAVVHRGHEGVREAFQAYSDTMASFRYEFSEFRDLGDRVLAIGRFRTRGRKSGVEAESPIALRWRWSSSPAADAPSHGINTANNHGGPVFRCRP